MRYSDVSDVIVITRRHVGGILNVNKDELNCDCAFRLLHISKHNSSQEYVWLRHRTANIEYLQHGGVYCCRQNDVTGTPCIHCSLDASSNLSSPIDLWHSRPTDDVQPFSAHQRRRHEWPGLSESLPDKLFFFQRRSNNSVTGGGRQIVWQQGDAAWCAAAKNLHTETERSAAQALREIVPRGTESSWQQQSQAETHRWLLSPAECPTTIVGYQRMISNSKRKQRICTKPKRAT